MSASTSAVQGVALRRSVACRRVTTSSALNSGSGLPAGSSVSSNSTRVTFADSGSFRNPGYLGDAVESGAAEVVGFDVAQAHGPHANDLDGAGRAQAVDAADRRMRALPVAERYGDPARQNPPAALRVELHDSR